MLLLAHLVCSCTRSCQSGGILHLLLRVVGGWPSSGGASVARKAGWLPAPGGQALRQPDTLHHLFEVRADNQGILCAFLCHGKMAFAHIAMHTLRDNSSAWSVCVTGSPQFQTRSSTLRRPLPACRCCPSLWVSWKHAPINIERHTNHHRLLS